MAGLSVDQCQVVEADLWAFGVAEAIKSPCDCRGFERLVPLLLHPEVEYFNVSMDLNFDYFPRVYPILPPELLTCILFSSQYHRHPWRPVVNNFFDSYI